MNAALVKRAIPLILVLAAIGVVLAYKLPGWFLDDRGQIEQAVRGLLDAARQRQVNAFLDRLSPKYRDSLNPNRETLAERARYVWLTYRVVDIDLKGEPAITFDPSKPDAAVADFEAVVMLGREAGKPADDPLIRKARNSDKFRLLFRKENGRWLIVSCESPDHSARSSPFDLLDLAPSNPGVGGGNGKTAAP